MNYIKNASGLSFKSLLDVLVYTEKSETPKKAFWRYFHTGIHVDSWFASDIFEKNSAGQKSIKKVRMIHRSVALKITKHKGRFTTQKYLVLSTNYTEVCLVGRLSNRTILPEVGLTGQFWVFGVLGTGQLVNLGKIAVLLR